MLIALAGNQNCGKTTLFNLLTGSAQHTGNFPGVTVEYHKGALRKTQNAILMDLPGVYSLTPYSAEETVTRDALLQAEGIINIVDASHLPRNLYLTLQLTELGLPMVLAVNMMDEAEKNGIYIDFSKLSAMLGIPAVAISARKNTGTEQLIHTILEQVNAGRRPVPPAPAHPGEDYLFTADRRYRYVELICQQCILRKNKRKDPTQRLDRIFMHSKVSIPIFASILLLIFYLTFGPVGGSCKQWMEHLIQSAAAHLAHSFFDLPPLLQSLIEEGIFQGVGSVLSFLPCILILFFCLSLLEDSGYLARISFLADKPMQTIGLSGRSVVPFLTGFGCSVPAAASARTMPSQRDKILTVLFLPFVSCSAKLPVYTTITSAVFPQTGFFLIFLLYLSGLLWGILNTAFSHKFLIKGQSESFVMELPPYRMPNWKTSLRFTLERAKDFMIKAFTVIFTASVIIWCMQTFTPQFQPANRFDQSILVQIGSVLSPLFAPLGFGDTKLVAALFAGLGAKEAVISTLSVLCKDLTGVFTPLSAFSFLHFVLLYMPCAAAFAAIRREIGTISALLAMIYQTALAWIISFGIYQLGLLIFS